jgi:hypothetical protein
MMMTKSYRKAILTAALGLALVTVLGLAAPAFAGETAKLRQPTTAAESKALAAGLQAMFKSTATPLQLKQFSDGTMAINLGTAFLNISVAQTQPDGSLRQVCVDSADAANVLSTNAPAYEEK